MGRMEMDDRSGGGARLVEGLVERHLLRRPVAGDELAIGVEATKPCRIELAEGRTGRRDQKPAIGKPHRDIAGGAVRQAAVEHRAGKPRRRPRAVSASSLMAVLRREP